MQLVVEPMHRMAPASALLSTISAALLLLAPPVPPAHATGLESIALPPAPDMGTMWAGISDAQKQKIADADDTFAKSDTLKVRLRFLLQQASGPTWLRCHTAG